MTQKVLVIGHSDADGHVIAEQARRNLALVPGFDVRVVVDPKRTQGHQSWLKLDELPEIERADLVFFVDLMFSPMAFDEESAGLIRLARSKPDKRFFVIDHHPLPLGRLRAKNIRVAYRPDVFECVIGPRSGMMVLAAICERQKDTIANVRTEHHDVLALGLRRAAAPGGSIAGQPLMSLLRNHRWDMIYALGLEDSSCHRLVRGRRVSSGERSAVMAAAEHAAEKPKESFLNEKMLLMGAGERRITAMPYDVEVERFVREQADAPLRRNELPSTKDLEALVTLLEVAALSLSDSPDATFSRDELLREAQTIAGEAFSIDERDARSVLEKASFVTGSVREMRLR